MAIIAPADPYTTKIVLQTSRGRDISNEQFYEISHHELASMADIERRHGNAITLRCKPDPIYNCHGMVFASRRTSIWEITEIPKILADDCYEEVGKENVLPGDLILYYGGPASSRVIDHSGIVIAKPLDNELGIPIIYSKWGKYAEFVHPANQCPYDFSTARYFRISRN